MNKKGLAMIKFPINLHSMTPIWKTDPEYEVVVESINENMDDASSLRPQISEPSKNEHVIQRLFNMRTR